MIATISFIAGVVVGAALLIVAIVRAANREPEPSEFDLFYGDDQ